MAFGRYLLCGGACDWNGERDSFYLANNGINGSDVGWDFAPCSIVAVGAWSLKTTLRTLAIAFVAALFGVYVGRGLLDHQPAPKYDIHAFIHEHLALDKDQMDRLAVLESQFALRRTALEMQLRSDNALLAEAIEAEHGAGPRVDAAIDRSHDVMGRLQKETLAHVFAMRQLLRPDQATKFDQAVVKALTEDRREP